LKHKPSLVAAAFAMQVVGDIPQEATDCSVEWLVTENETIDCRVIQQHA
jgi:5-formyltetrahydrofolate cyclo-ligase